MRCKFETCCSFGGAGFIGTNLAYRLIEENRQVYNFDNLSGSGNLLNIADLMQKPHHILPAATFPMLMKSVKRFLQLQ